MLCVNRFQAFSSRYPLLTTVIAGALWFGSAQAQSTNLDEFCIQFPQNSRCANYQVKPWTVDPDLSQGKAVAEHNQGQFQGQILIPADQEEVWQVLTDYNSFAEFLPGVIENQATVMEQSEDRRSLVMNSTSVTQVFLAQIESSIRLQLQENPYTQIEFSLLEGDSLSQLQGRWQLQTIPAPDSAEFQDQDRVTWVSYQANAVSTVGPQGVFAGIFAEQIRQNLKAIQQETLRRLSAST